MRAIDGLAKTVRTVAFTPDGKLALVACWDEHAGSKPTLGCFTVPGGPFEELSRHPEYVDLAVSPAGRLVAASAWRAPLEIWDVTTKRKWTAPPTADGTFAFSPDGQRLVGIAGDGKSLAISKVELRPDGTVALLEEKRVDGIEWNFSLARFTSDGTEIVTLASSVEGVVVLLWSATTGLEVGRVAASSALSSRDLALSPDGRSCFVADRTGVIRVDLPVAARR